MEMMLYFVFELNYVISFAIVMNKNPFIKNHMVNMLTGLYLDGFGEMD